eukprot:evm.model.scf_18.19 EVM.evm.TU.scf_18.19   scf_18:116890-119276(+)
MKLLWSPSFLGGAARPVAHRRVATAAFGGRAGRRLAARATASQAQESAVTSAAPDTLYKRLGGEAHLQGVINSFYRKAYADERLNHWFEGYPPARMEAKMARFFKFCFGEVPTYKGRDMGTAHASLVQRGLNDGDYDVLVELFTAAFRESGVSDDLTNEVVTILESVRDPVLCRDGHDIPT